MRCYFLGYMGGVLVLAGVLGANLTPRTKPSIGFGGSWNPYDQKWIAFRHSHFGWPYMAMRQGEMQISPDPSQSCRWTLFARRWYHKAFALDIAIGLAIPIACLLSCEFMLRRFSPRRKVE